MALQTEETHPPDESQVNASGVPSRRLRHVIGLVMRVLLILIVLVAGWQVSGYLVETAPKAKRKPPVRRARLVEVMSVQLSSQATLVRAMGTVRPAREIVLQPRVSGNVIEVSSSFVPGGRFAQGERVLRLDAADYNLTIRQRRSDLAKAQAALKLERGNQLVARQEYKLLGQTIRGEERDLVLRGPQLATVRADVAAAQAALDQARLNLERATIQAPFNALVASRQVELGAQVNTATPLATLVDTDVYWVEAIVPVSQLKWLTIPRAPGEAGSTVRISNPSAWGPELSRQGVILRLKGDLEDEGRMAQVLIAVDDPLSLKDADASAPPLLLNAYVQVEFQGQPLDEVVVLDRNLLRGGDQLWLLTHENKLEIRPVTIAFRGRDTVFVASGVQEGDRVITSALPAPVAGMPLRLAPSSE